LLAPEQHVVLDNDAAGARALAREYLTTYWSLPNYLDNFRRMGFTDADFEAGGSDRMVDELVAWGEADRIADRIARHFEAGADHVAVQVLVPGKRGFPRGAWRQLARALEDLR
jgi:probable F420-dependent oxidoreductase